MTDVQKDFHPHTLKQINDATETCEACQGHKRIEIEPDSPHCHPCDNCQPEHNKAFWEGVEYGKIKKQISDQEFEDHANQIKNDEMV